MSQVFLDGEKVDFHGPAPASFSEVRSVLEAALAERGRVLAALSLDGQPFDESLGNRPLADARVDAVSLALADAVAQVGAALVPELVALRDGVGALAREVLRVPWTEVQARCVHHVESATHVLQRAVEVAAISGDGSAAAQAVAALASDLEKWMEAIQQGDAAAIALQLDGAVARAFGQLVALWQPKAVA